MVLVNRPWCRRLPALLVILLAAPALGEVPVGVFSGARVEAVLDTLEPEIRARVATLHDAARAADARPGVKAGDRAAAWGELGRAALSYELDELAAAAFAAAERLAPDDVHWPYLAGVVHQRQRRLDVAADAFRRALALAPDDLPAAVRLAQVELLRGDVDAARPLFERAAEQPPWIAPARYGLGRIAAAEGDHAGARRHFERALEAQGDAAEIHQQLGLTLRELGELDAAREVLATRPGGRLEIVDPLLSAIAERYPRSELFRGFLDHREGRLAEAVAHYRAVVARDPENATHRLALGDALAESGDHDAALEAFRAAARLAPEHAFARLRLGVALFRRDGLTPEARGHFDAALELIPDFEDAHRELGRALAAEGRFAEAAERFAAALETDPDDAANRGLLGQALVELGQAERALTHLDAALAAAPDDHPSRLARGRALVRLGRVDEALTENGRILAAEAEPAIVAQAHVQRAWIVTRQGRPREAVELYEKALELDPVSRPARLGLAALLRRLAATAAAEGRHADAAALLERALAAAESADVPPAQLVPLRQELARYRAGGAP